MANSNFNNPNLRKRPQRRNPSGGKQKPPNNNWLFFIVLGFMLLILLSQSNQVSNMSNLKTPEELSYSEFAGILKTNDQSGRIVSLELIESTENTLKGV